MAAATLPLTGALVACTGVLEDGPGDHQGPIVCDAPTAPEAPLGKANRSSPIARGVFVRERLLCDVLPAPPGDVDLTPPISIRR
jgi:hypothetical protein